MEGRFCGSWPPRGREAGASFVLEDSTYLKFFAALFAIINPIGAIPVFLSVTRDNSDGERRRIATLTTVSVLIVLLITAALGDWILSFFGIRIAAFQVAGGLIILLMAIAMLQAHASAVHHSASEVQEGAEKDNPAVFPLAIPLIAGPGSITTVLLYGDDVHGIGDAAMMVTIIALISAVVYVALSSAVRLGKLMGPTGVKVVTRLMGMLLAAIAVELISSGLTTLLPGLAQTGGSP
jgi:multiple antibiotic resistance protein